MVVLRDVGAEVVQGEAFRVGAGQLGEPGTQLALRVVAALRAHGQQQGTRAEGVVFHPLLGQPQDVFALVQHPDVQHDRLLGRQSQTGPKGGDLCCGRGVERGNVHAVGQMVDPRGAQPASAEFLDQIPADAHAGTYAAQHEPMDRAHDRARQTLQVVVGQTGLHQRLEAHHARQGPDEGVGEIGAVAVQDVDVPAARPDMPGQVEPQAELAVFERVARLQPLHRKALDHRHLAKTGPAVGDEFDMVAAATQLPGQGQGLQGGTAVLRLEVSCVHQDPHGAPDRVGITVHVAQVVVDFARAAFVTCIVQTSLSCFSSHAPSITSAQTRKVRR